MSGKGLPGTFQGIWYDRKALGNQRIYVCAEIAGGWKLLSDERTDLNGVFKVPVSALPPGLTKLYLSVVEHETGAEFRALIATADTKLVVSDVDGTLTQFEYPQFHQPPGTLFDFENISTIGENPGASRALVKLHDAGYQIVYLTARADGATDATRAWLRKFGFPEGCCCCREQKPALPATRTSTKRKGSWRLRSQLRSRRA